MCVGMLPGSNAAFDESCGGGENPPLELVSYITCTTILREGLELARDE